VTDFKEYIARWPSRGRDMAQTGIEDID